VKITTLLLFLIGLSLGFIFYSTFCTWIFFKKEGQGRKESANGWPPVSVLKPVSGLEDGSLANFMSFCDQDYPDYEIIFSLSQEKELMTSLLEDLKKLFPKRDIRWVISNENKGPNYKVENLIGAVREAKYGILAVSDGDMRVDRNYLKRVTRLLLQERVGLVTCLYRGTDIQNIFSGLLSLTVQTDFIPNVLLDHRLESISYAFGATILTTKEVLKSFGGFGILQEYLADDYQIGNQVHKKGYRICLSPYLIDHIFSIKNAKEYCLHRLRWAVTQRACRPIGYLASIITQGVFLALLFLILKGFSSVAVPSSYSCAASVSLALFLSIGPLFTMTK
jgi:ceramide glucosyltransferase